MSDFCYSRPMLNRVMRQAEVMDRMMEVIGVDPAVAIRLDRGMGWYEARGRCIACRSDERCTDWLRKSSTGISAEPPPFCPNVAFFYACGTAMEDHQ